MRLCDLIRKAREAEACSTALDELEKLGSLADVRKHSRAPEWASWYAFNVIEGRWPEAEDIIRTDPKCAYGYALEIINGRWPEAENIIRTDPHWAQAAAELLHDDPDALQIVLEDYEL